MQLCHSRNISLLIQKRIILPVDDAVDIQLVSLMRLSVEDVPCPTLLVVVADRLALNSQKNSAELQ